MMRFWKQYTHCVSGGRATRAQSTLRIMTADGRQPAGQSDIGILPPESPESRI